MKGVYSSGDLPNGSGADERRAEADAADALEFAGDARRGSIVAGHGVVLLLDLGLRRQDDFLLLEIGTSVEAESLAAQVEAVAADGHHSDPEESAQADK